MKTIQLHIRDETKTDLVIQFLQEIRWLQVEQHETDMGQVKTMQHLPQSILHPRMAKSFRKLSREELHERRNLH
jgi:hypothetical protein